MPTATLTERQEHYQKTNQQWQPSATTETVSDPRRPNLDKDGKLCKVAKIKFFCPRRACHGCSQAMTEAERLANPTTPLADVKLTHYSSR